MTTQYEKPILVISKGKNAGEQIALEKEVFVIGRDLDCDLVLAEQQVSRQHITIKRVERTYRMEDLDSRNGTWLNGEQVRGEHPLNSGDVIELAQVVRMTFIESGATAPMPRDALGGRRLRLDKDARRAFVNGQEMLPPLSLPQYRLLELLIDAEGGVITRDEVVRAVWPDVQSDGVSEQAIDALVRRLRDRISEIDPENQYILTIRGHGFRVDQG
jgi:DNA-binding response OmpR family regulator